MAVVITERAENIVARTGTLLTVSRLFFAGAGAEAWETAVLELNAFVQEIDIETF